MKNYEGKTIRLLKMNNDPHPIPLGTKGVVTKQQVVTLGGITEIHLEVDWEIKRSLKVILPEDEVEIIEEP